MTNQYNWVDNPTEAQVAQYNPDILNECLMHLKYDNIPANNTICCFNKGNTDLNGFADLIDAQLTTNLVFSQPGTYTVNIPESGNYDVVLVGGGAGGAWGFDVYAVRSTASGGSGAAFVGNIYIPAGTYTCTVGNGGADAGNGGYGGAGGTTSINGIISAGGGAYGAYATWGIRQQSVGGTISVNTTVNSATINSNGNNGTTAYNDFSAGGASLYSGLGKGGDAYPTYAVSGNAGYLSIKMSGASYINYKIGGNYAPLKGTLNNGESFVINGLNSDNALYLSNGTYNKFVGADGSGELLKNTVFKQAASPAASVGDVWYNTALEPCSLLKWNGTAWENYEKIPLGSFTVNNGTVTDFRTFSYNQNGHRANMNCPLGKPSVYFKDLVLPASGSSVVAPFNGYVQLAALSCNSLQLYNTTRSSFWQAIDNQNGSAASISVPCQKGDNILLYYNITTLSWFRCYADEGSY